jgi:hypothetical protein
MTKEKKKKKTFLEYLEDIDYTFIWSTRNWTLWGVEEDE